MSEVWETVVNPKTDRFIKKGGATHKRLIREGLLDNTITLKKRNYKIL